ncbi:MAG: glycosyltransferase [Bacteroidota bacterium]
MLSVLLPTYSYPVRPLVAALQQQLSQQKFSWEILVVDDASPIEDRLQNAGLEDIDYRIRYLQLDENLGRAGVRNLLALEARYDKLLFLDADSKIPADFITSYRPFLDRDCVICGGRVYQQKPDDPKYLLHWVYGNQRESKSAEQRRKNPYFGFQTNNFVVPKTLLQDHPFEEASVAYGHEDTLWGYQLQSLGIEILHLDNAVEHLGLEDYDTFLRKQQEAVQNLVKLEKMYPGLPTRLGNSVQKTTVLHAVIRPCLSFLAPYLREQIAQDIPGSLYYLDAMKMQWYLAANNQKLLR